MKKVQSNKGFTLVELIIVIAILAIIMLIAIPNFSGIQQRMKVRADKATAAQIGKAVRVWYTDYTTDETLKNSTAAEGEILPAGLEAPTAAKTVELVEYGSLKEIDSYVTKGQTANSLLDTDGKSVAGKYCVFLTAEPGTSSAKIAIAICDAAGAQTKIAGITGDSAPFAVAVAYDGNTTTEITGGVAYVEP